MSDIRATRADLFRVFMAGVKCGSASTLGTYYPGATSEVIAEAADHLIESIEGDPLASDALADRAVQVASGIDPEAVEFKAFGGTGEKPLDDGRQR